MFQCLQENIAKSGFGEQCQVEIQKREARMQDDYRLDYGVASQCEADVEQWCSLEKVMVLRPYAKSVVKFVTCNIAVSIKTLTAYKEEQYLNLYLHNCRDRRMERRKSSHV